ncbi:MAG: serpin family protein [Coleofasciculus chthonoplastes F3-SA18-01]|uniref:serpin family protein n=1 Tax=Coleofasciculus chthonoplastes TaxID=64178 RepID=UPI0032FE027B
MNQQILRRTGIIAAGIIFAGLLAGLISQKINAQNSSNPQKPELIAQQPNLSVDTQIVEANTKFGFKLFSEILQENSNKNVFISPTSVAIALAMTYNGASGETQAAMANALELQGMSLSEVNQANEALKTTLENADSDIQLSIANSLWAKQDISFKPDFLRRNQEFYDTQVTNLDFANPEAKRVINNWVKENTNGKIPQIISEIQPNDILFLINAIYFKGNWMEQFDKDKTVERPFYLVDGTQKEHPMMSQSGEYQYYEDDTVQAISLPYGKGRLSFYVFLPRETVSLDTFEQQLTPENWQQWMNRFGKRDGSIVLPRFKLEYEIQLNKALKALGMDVAFDDRADFSNMTEADVLINQVKHKTFVEVNEEGTEAAAATSVGMVLTSAAIPQTPFEMVVDRPFFCAIRDNQTGTILFMGSIREPK